MAADLSTGRAAVDVFVFRRDLRLVDNTALTQLVSRSRNPLVLLFVLDPAQLNGSYRSVPARDFMAQRLRELDTQLRGRLWTCRANSTRMALRRIPWRIQCVAFNQDHTPYAGRRDTQLRGWCETHGIRVLACKDEYTLREPGSVGRYRRYAAFVRAWHRCGGAAHVRRPAQWPAQAWTRRCIAPPPSFSLKNVLAPLTASDSGTWGVRPPRFVVHLAGILRAPATVRLRELALMTVRDISTGRFEDYSSTRDTLHPRGTTRLSPFIKFGCVSVREVYWTVVDRHGKDHALVRELLWREFYAHLCHSFPETLRGQLDPTDMHIRNQALWPHRNAASVGPTTEERFRHWCAGFTGVPLVDAAMRSLVALGWLHNRLRMLVACFLCRDLDIDWRRGERFFATVLVDYDPCSNSGGWQWAAGVAPECLPPFRRFSPYRQSIKLDPDCTFIWQWVPELASVAPSDVHAWHLRWHLHPGVHRAPIVPMQKTAVLNT
jgi:deoxyribodipyrimidine photo-lyase